MKLPRLLFSVFVIAFSVTAARLRRPRNLRALSLFQLLRRTTSTIFSAEIADTDELRARGLMFRHKLPEDRAMLFDFGKPRPASMWMKNTYISLDMLFVREDGTIAAVAENTEPLSLQTISVQEPVKAVVEVAAGTVKRLGIQRDDKVFHSIFKTEEEIQ